MDKEFKNQDVYEASIGWDYASWNEHIKSTQLRGGNYFVYMVQKET